MSKRAAIRTTVDEIVKYWACHQDESGLSVDWAEARERCWRCVRKKRLQKCHIIPHALGGTELPENLVLLCVRCHREAPDASDSTFMWTWFRKNAVSLYETDWIIRGCAEFEKIFGRKPIPNMSEAIQKKELEKAYKKFRRKAIVHFGEGRQSPSTMAWIFSQIENELAGRGAGNTGNR